MSKKFEFFNKQDGVIEDMNIAITETIQNLKDYLIAQSSIGFYDNFGNDSVGTKGNLRPEFIPGTTVPTYDYISIPMTPAISDIMGIDIAGNLIIIDANVAYQIADITISSGNTNVPLDTDYLGNPLSVTQPYDRYIWIEYRETTNPSITRTDFDGGLHGGPGPYTNPPYLGPVKDDGYNILITDQDPSTLQPGTNALYIGKITVDSNIQTYDYAPSAAPIYKGQLRAGMLSKNIQIRPSSISKTAIYTNNSAFSNQQKPYSLNEHINCFGNGNVTPENPHGVAPDDMLDVDGDNITDHSIVQLNLSREADPDGGAVGTNEIKDLNVTHAKLAVDAVETNNVKNANITPEKLSVPLANSFAPIGSVIMYAGSVSAVPTGWALCDGSDFSSITYPDLWNVLEDIWGPGSAGTTVRLPNLMGAFLRGATTGVTSDPDVASRIANKSGTGSKTDTGSEQDDELKSHIHYAGHESGNPNTGGAAELPLQFTSDDHATTSTGGNETRPKNYNIAYIIRYV